MKNWVLAPQIAETLAQSRRSCVDRGDRRQPPGAKMSAVNVDCATLMRTSVGVVVIDRVGLPTEN